MERSLAEIARRTPCRLTEARVFALASVRGSADIQFAMKVCLDVETLVESATPQLKEIAEVAASFKDPNTDEACVAFARQVSMLEGSLKQTFRGATLLARKSGELEEIAKIWKNLIRFCTSVLTTLVALREKYPYCGTQEIYDLALDYKKACEDRLRDAEEEIECQRMDLPKGLLPELN